MNLLFIPLPSLKTILITLALIFGLTLFLNADDHEEWEEHNDHEKPISVVEIEAFLAEHLPGTAAELKELHKRDVHEYIALLEEVTDHYILHWETHDENPELADALLTRTKLSSEINRLIEEWHESDDAPLRKETQAELQTALESMFNVEHKITRLEIARMRTEVEGLQSDLEAETDEREDLINEFLKDVLHGDDHEDHDDDDDHDHEHDKEQEDGK